MRYLKTRTNAANIFCCQRIKTHGELIAALLSGVLILAGWLISKQQDTAVSITLFVLAYVIGGFAKAKEGIEETIENKELNVEMLMIIAAIERL